MFNHKILFACFLIPILLLLPLQLLRHLFATCYGGYFDEPGIGWVILYCCIIGGLFGAICALMYVGIMGLIRHKPHYTAAAILAMGLFAFAINFLSSHDAEHEDTRINHLIRWVAYQIFYSPVADSIICEDKPIPSGFHNCIPSMTHLKVLDPSGDFEITTGKGLLRTYSWAGGSRSITMFPAGNHELNYPESKKNRWQKWPYFDWKMHDGIAQFYGLENILNFSSTKDVETWIQNEKAQHTKYILMVYRNDGLVIIWSKNHIDPDTLVVMVYQLLINSQKPSSLPGAEDKRIIQSS